MMTRRVVVVVNARCGFQYYHLLKTMPAVFTTNFNNR